MVCFCCFLIWDIICPEAVIHTVLKTYRLQFYLAAVQRLILLLFFLTRTRAVITQSPGAVQVKTKQQQQKTTVLHSTEYSCLWVKRNSVHGIRHITDQVQETQVMNSWVIRVGLKVSYLQDVLFKNTSTLFFLTHHSQLIKDNVSTTL